MGDNYLEICNRFAMTKLVFFLSFRWLCPWLRRWHPFLKRSRKSCESFHLCSDVVEILLVDWDRKMACLIFIPSGFLVATNWNNGHSFSPGFHWGARCGFITWRVLSLFFRQIRKPLIILTTVTFLKDWLPSLLILFSKLKMSQTASKNNVIVSEEPLKPISFRMPRNGAAMAAGC